MSLTTNRKPSTKQIQHHRKRSGDHQRRSKNFHKAYWPYLPMLGVGALVIVASGAVVLGLGGAIAGGIVASIAVVVIIL
jgi:hypothetical protein